MTETILSDPPQGGDILRAVLLAEGSDAAWKVIQGPIVRMEREDGAVVAGLVSELFAALAAFHAERRRLIRVVAGQTEKIAELLVRREG